MTLNTFKCNHVTPLHCKGLMCALLRGYITSSDFTM